jgi:hypothetical protein
MAEALAGYGEHVWPDRFGDPLGVMHADLVSRPGSVRLRPHPEPWPAMVGWSRHGAREMAAER